MKTLAQCTQLNQLLPEANVYVVTRKRTRSANGNSTYYLTLHVVRFGMIYDLTQEVIAFLPGVTKDKETLWLKSGDDGRALVARLGDALFADHATFHGAQLSYQEL